MMSLENQIVPSTNSASNVVPYTYGEDWTEAVSKILKQRNLQCIEQTGESSKELQSRYGFFSDGKTMSNYIESSLFESFQEDDYGGKLHLTTIQNTDGETLGLVFWREVDSNEMRKWIDQKKLVEVAREWLKRGRKFVSPSSSIGDASDVEKAGAAILSDGIDKPEQQKALSVVRRKSCTWLEKSGRNLLATNEQNNIVKNQQEDDDVILPDSVYQHWVKIELLAVRPKYWGQRVGSLLLACAMYRALLLCKQQHNQNNCKFVLHVAGGTSNIPAIRLYQKFGFVPSPPSLFHKPDKDIYVLGDVQSSLQSILWSETLLLHNKDN